MNQWIDQWMNDWMNWHLWVKVNELTWMKRNEWNIGWTNLTWMKFNEWMEVNELKWKSWNEWAEIEWIGMKELTWLNEYMTEIRYMSELDDWKAEAIKMNELWSEWVEWNDWTWMTWHECV